MRHFLPLVVLLIVNTSSYGQSNKELLEGSIITDEWAKNNPSKIQYIVVGKGPEDFEIDTLSTSSPRLIIACGDFKNNDPRGKGFWYWNLHDKAHEAQKFSIVGYPEENIGPHGIALYHDSTKHTSYLYAISHEQKRKVHQLLVFEINENTLIFQKSYSSETDSIIQSPNDLFVEANGDLYFSNPEGFKSFLSRKKKGYVAKINQDGTSEIQCENLGYPNGIFIKNNDLYISTTSGNQLFKTQLHSNQTKPILPVAYRKGGDNILYQDEKLYMACHPKVGKFIPHVLFGFKSPSLIYSYDLRDGRVQQIMYSKGKLISGSSTAVVYNKHLYIGQVLNNHILRIELPDR